MAYEIPEGEPTEIAAGDLIKWLIPEYSSFPIVDGWVLSYALVMDGNQELLTATDNGDKKHLVTVAAAVSAGWTVGTYKWNSYVTNGAERYRVGEGSLVVTPDFAALTTGYDGRSHWQVTLTNIEAVIQGRATKDQSSYTINGRQLSRTPVADLLMLYNKAKSAVASEEKAERIANGLGNSGKILVRFDR